MPTASPRANINNSPIMQSFLHGDAEAQLAYIADMVSEFAAEADAKRVEFRNTRIAPSLVTVEIETIRPADHRFFVALDRHFPFIARMVVTALGISAGGAVIEGVANL